MCARIDSDQHIKIYCVCFCIRNRKRQMGVTDPNNCAESKSSDMKMVAAECAAYSKCNI